MLGARGEQVPVAVAVRDRIRDALEGRALLHVVHGHAEHTERDVRHGHLEFQAPGLRTELEPLQGVAL